MKVKPFWTFFLLTQCTISAYLVILYRICHVLFCRVPSLKRNIPDISPYLRTNIMVVSSKFSLYKIKRLLSVFCLSKIFDIGKKKSRNRGMVRMIFLLAWRLMLPAWPFHLLPPLHRKMKRYENIEK